MKEHKSAEKELGKQLAKEDITKFWGSKECDVALFPTADICVEAIRDACERMARSNGKPRDAIVEAMILLWETAVLAGYYVRVTEEAKE